MQTLPRGEKLWEEQLDVIVKFENQSKRKFLPVCWTRAGSGKVEGGEAYIPSQTGNVGGG